MPQSKPELVAAPAKITTNAKMEKALASASKSKAEASGYKAGAETNAGVTNQVFLSGSRSTLQLSRSQPGSDPMKTNTDACNSGSPSNRKVFAKPTLKLMEAVQNRGFDSKPLQVKLVRREGQDDEDTTSYESDSSGSTLSVESPLHQKANDTVVNNVPKVDISSLLQDGTINMSQMPEKKVADPADFPGVPIWFPVKIKRILKDDGFPDALPFKSVHKLTRYRAWLEARRRQRWRRYLKAGKCRWQLGNAIRKIREQPGSAAAALYKRRAYQHGIWKGKAIRAMKKLDVIIGAITYLDESMAGIFEAECEVYKKYLN